MAMTNTIELMTEYKYEGSQYLVHGEVKILETSDDPQINIPIILGMKIFYVAKSEPDEVGEDIIWVAKRPKDYFRPSAEEALAKEYLREFRTKK